MKKKIPARGSLIIKEIKLKEKDVGVEGGGGFRGERKREREERKFNQRRKSTTRHNPW
jgi:hypothetical protein